MRAGSVTKKLLTLPARVAELAHFTWGVPLYFASFTLKIIPKDLSIAQLKAGWGVFTVCLIALLFALTKASTHWRQVLAAALVVSTALAVMACALIAA